MDLQSVYKQFKSVLFESVPDQIEQHSEDSMRDDANLLSFDIERFFNKYSHPLVDNEPEYGDEFNFYNNYPLYRRCDCILMPSEKSFVASLERGRCTDFDEDAICVMLRKVKKSTIAYFYVDDGFASAWEWNNFKKDILTFIKKLLNG